MAEENTYEYQCMRAELLGLEKPDKDAFDLEQQKIREMELHDIELSESLAIKSESCERTKGKLDELNTLLSKTQQKINTFKGSPVKSLTRMFSKQKMDETDLSSNIANDQNSKKVENVNNKDNSIFNQNNSNATTSNSNFTNQEAKTRSLEIDKKMNSHLDKLDELINKAEKADMSMTHQNKQMKKFIKK